MSKTVLSIGADAVVAVTARLFHAIFFVARLHFNFRQFIFQSLIFSTLSPFERTHAHKHTNTAKNVGNYFIFSSDFLFHSPSFCFITYENAGLTATI